MNHQKKIQHLYWRAGFGLSPNEWQKNINRSISSNVDGLFSSAAAAPTLNASTKIQSIGQLRDLDSEAKKKLKKQNRKRVQQQNYEWVLRMGSSDHSALLEKMCLFWHGHFACISRNGQMALQQLSTIRQHALGNFRDLLLAIAKDTSMIRFLNNQQNRKNQPNENFARELMELFTIGRGHYSEKDIKEAARAFTGWSSNLRGEFVFRKRQHDFGMKFFMGKSGRFGGEDIIDIILERKETARFLTRKIYRFFVNDLPDEDRVHFLAKDFYQSNYNIQKLMRSIFESNWFYEEKNIGVKIKSPIELMAGIIRKLDVRFKNHFSILFVERALGQVLFQPPNVAGWPGGKSWIDNSTLMLRLNLVGYLFHSSEVNFRTKAAFESTKRNKPLRKLQATVDLQPLTKLFRGQSERQIFEQASAFILQTDQQPDKSLFDDYIIHSDEDAFIRSLILRLMSLPEYQVC